jgi:hypothetical protein
MTCERFLPIEKIKIIIARLISARTFNSSVRKNGGPHLGKLLSGTMRANVNAGRGSSNTNESGDQAQWRFTNNDLESVI